MSTFILIAIWLFPLIVWAAPQLYRTAAADLRALRARGWPALCIAIILLVACTLAGGSKGPPPPPPPARAIINLYYHAPDGRLVPLGHPIKEERYHDQ